MTYAVDMLYGEQTFEITVPLEGVNVDAADLLDPVVDRGFTLSGGP